jgi:hypothetical protein
VGPGEAAAALEDLALDVARAQAGEQFLLAHRKHQGA